MKKWLFLVAVLLTATTIPALAADPQAQPECVIEGRAALDHMIQGGRKDFSGCKIRGHLVGLRGPGLILKGTDLTGMNLSGANLKEANLTKANLEETKFEGAKFEGAKFEGAKFGWANLRGANLRGANLERANLEEANLEGAKFGEVDEPPIHELCGFQGHPVDRHIPNLSEAQYWQAKDCKPDPAKK